ncbi:MAG TPA: putative peptidoglycan glycosyltransferase FtsW [Candidatus Paceibacterota bacterium]|nr:putative peptidoglycan glycosyltransferase FtsW [Candidatus Paceibacterota bacterium]
MKAVDKPFLISILILVIAGLFIFSSASLGLLAGSGATFKSVLINQIVLGVVLGSLACYINNKIPYKFWRKYALFIFVGSILSVLLIFVPHIGFKYNGARRWISLGSFSLQPSEIFKVGFVIYFAAWLSGVKQKVDTFKYGSLPFAILIAIAAILMLIEPDTATFGVIFIAGLSMFVVAGCRWRDLFILGLIGIIGIGVLYVSRPYIRQRIDTFIHPANDALGSGYQIQQSLIAIGAGRLTGRGFGQSIQKFNYLPEPIGDSIFAVAAEEFGFVGASLIILLYLFFTFRGLRIAAQTPDLFGRLLVTGLVILILAESFINIASMLGILPVSGIPLLFISHGGTALFFTLAEVGIILNVSRYTSKR